MTTGDIQTSLWMLHGYPFLEVYEYEFPDGIFKPYILINLLTFDYIDPTGL